MNDMIFFKLTANKESKERREKLGMALGIGYCNTNQFIKRLNNFGITKEEFIKAIKDLDKGNE